MSRENVELVLRGFELCEQERIEDLIATYAEDAVIASHTERARLTGDEFRGRDAIRDFYRDFFDSYRELSYEIERVEGLDDRVVVVYVLSALGRSSGVPIRRRFACYDRIEDGLVAEENLYRDPDDALAAAGLLG
jgi:ketosteroid isomerase-like protein